MRPSDTMYRPANSIHKSISKYFTITTSKKIGPKRGKGGGGRGRYPAWSKHYISSHPSWGVEGGRELVVLTNELLLYDIWTVAL